MGCALSPHCSGVNGLCLGSLGSLGSRKEIGKGLIQSLYRYKLAPDLDHQDLPSRSSSARPLNA